jgi:hypothetical protein
MDCFVIIFGYLRTKAPTRFCISVQKKLFTCIILNIIIIRSKAPTRFCISVQKTIYMHHLEHHHHHQNKSGNPFLYN